MAFLVSQPLRPVHGNRSRTSHGLRKEESFDECVHQLFEEHAHSVPDKVAVVCKERLLTYGELNARANQLAYHLRTLGVGPEALVAVCLTRSVDTVVAILAILKAGGAWLPLDPTQPKDRQSILFKDARVAVVLTERSVLPELPEHGTKTVLLDSDWFSISMYRTGDLKNIASPTNLAYVMYTSGSTGQPKGVLISHANLCSYVRAIRQSLGIASTDIYLHTATVAFSSSVRQFMVPLTQGAKLVIATNSEIGQPTALFETIKRERVTIADLVPSYWRSCFHALKGLDITIRRNLLENHLRLILAASEPLLTDLPRKWKSELRHSVKIVNMFGQTETTGIVATYDVPEEIADTGVMPIGRPIGSLEIHLLDTELRPVPFGTAGEIYVGGPTVGRGYLNQTELTAERFVPNPFSKKAGERLYKTGDLGRRRPDGNIDFLGRIDDQVKIRGIRVEPREVEAVLSEHASVQETAVAFTEDGTGDKRLIAYIVPKGRASNTTELRRFLKKKLPVYMMPSTFVFLHALPRTLTGKVDRQALPVPERVRPDVETAFEAPRTSLELQIAQIWEKLLAVHPIGVRDNFFDLGGHSLQAARLCIQIEKKFGKSVPVALLFQMPTIDQLARFLAQERLPDSEYQLVAVQPNGSKPAFFWVHGEMSDAFLPRYLGHDQPIYGLKHPTGDGKRALHTRVEDIAAGYLSEIVNHQPQGPYFMGGYSFGGLVAFEMAQQLRRQGQEVSLLVMLNPPRLALPIVPKRLP